MGDLRHRAREIFVDVVDLDQEQREEALRKACDGDGELRDAVERLLAAYQLDSCFAPELNAQTSDNLDSAKLPALAHSTSDKSDTSTAEFIGAAIGPYKILQLLGEGGMGTVYMADQEKPVRRRVALKIIKPGMDTQQVVARFEAERQALALMHHPNIAKVLDAGETRTGHPYFVMELVRGVPITDYCDQQRLDTRSRLELFVSVCQAVQHAHQKGIIHRDLKPTNILVELHDVNAVPKIIDFGVAKATEHKLTEKTLFTNFGQAVGTPLYMSPEQAQLSGLDVDTRSDIYSLGVLLYQLLCGTTPFDKETLRKASFDEMRRIIREDEPLRPSERISTLNAEALSTASDQRRCDARKLVQLLRGELDWIVMKALEKDRTRRYETAAAFAEDVRRHLNDESVQACPPSAAYRLRKLVRRHRVGVAFALTILFLLASASAVGAVLTIKAMNSEQLAQDRLKRVEAERNRAQAAEQLAEARREEAEAISQFLVEIFQSPDRSLHGETFTVVDALDRTMEKLEDEMADRPNVQARLKSTLSETYHALGMNDRAIPLKQDVVDYYARRAPDQDIERIDEIERLAAFFRGAGRVSEEIALREQLVQSLNQDLGADHPSTMEAKYALAKTYRRTGRTDDADQLEAAIRRSNLSTLVKNRNPQSLKDLASDYRKASRFLEAIEVGKLAMQGFEKTKGKGSNEYLAAMSDLARTYLDAGNKREAVELQERVVELTRGNLGDDSLVTLNRMRRLANMYFSTGMTTEGCELADELVERVRQSLQQQDVGALSNACLADFSSVLHDAGIDYRMVGRMQAALDVFEENNEFCRKAFGWEFERTHHGMDSLARQYALVGDYDHAISVFEQLLALQKRFYPREKGDICSVTNELARAYNEAGRFSKAREMVEDVRRLIEETNGGRGIPDDIVNAAKHLISVARGDVVFARKLEERDLRLKRDMLGVHHGRTLNAMNNLGVAYVRTGQHEQAVELWEEVLTHWTASKDRRDFDGDRGHHFPNAVLNLMAAYRISGRLDDARKLRATVIEDFPNYSVGRLLQGEILAEQGEYEQAIKEFDLAMQQSPVGPSSPAAWLNRQICLARIGAIDKFRASQSEYLAQFPNGPRRCACITVEAAWDRCASEKWEVPSEYWFALMPNSGVDLNRCVEQAREALAKLADDAPDDVQTRVYWLRELGTFLLRLERYEEAAKHLRQARDVLQQWTPQSAECVRLRSFDQALTHFVLAICEHHLGRTAEARDLSRQGAEISDRLLEDDSAELGWKRCARLAIFQDEIQRLLRQQPESLITEKSELPSQ